MSTLADVPPAPSPSAKPTARNAHANARRDRPEGTQKRLFRSISKFLSGGTLKGRPKPAGAAGRATGAAGGRGDAKVARGGSGMESEGGDAVQLRPFNGTRPQDIPRVDDAAPVLRPISLSSLGPSSFVSHQSVSTSNGSYAPTHQTVLSSTSTKPTTILSLDSNTSHANRIATAPPASLQQLPSSISGNSLAPPSSNPPITFSSLPTSSSLSSPPNGTHVPHHTFIHPRNNPNASSPPPDNASMLTLASSTFSPSLFSPSLLTTGGGAVSTGGSLSRLGRNIGADEDASVRALAGSRRGSEESLGSRSTWSAAPAGLGVKRDEAASLRTVGTGGTGDVLGLAGEGEGEAELEGEAGETEAQKVVRKESANGTQVDNKVGVIGGDTTPVLAWTSSTTTPSPLSVESSAMDDMSKSDLTVKSSPPHTTPTQTTSSLPLVTSSEVVPGRPGAERKESGVGRGRDTMTVGSGETDFDAQSFVDAVSVVSEQRGE